MISAFGIDHGEEIAKAAQLDPESMGRLKAHFEAKAKRRAVRSAARPRKPYFNPTEEQKAASQARRAAQQQAKANKQHIRVPGKPYRIVDHISSGAARNVALSGALGATAFGVLAHRKSEPVGKADTKDRAINAGLGAVGGAAAADVAQTVGGQAAKAAIKIRRAKRGESPHEARIWAEHKAKHGIRGRVSSSTATPKQKLRVYRSYPKELPDWRANRALAVKNNPKTAAAILATGAVAGGVYGGKKKPVGKSAFDVERDEVSKGASLPNRPIRLGEVDRPLDKVTRRLIRYGNRTANRKRRRILDDEMLVHPRAGDKISQRPSYRTRLDSPYDHYATDRLAKAYGRTPLQDAARWTAGMSGGAAAGGGAVYTAERAGPSQSSNSQAKRTAAAAVLGGAAGQGLYQVVGYDAKARGLRAEAKSTMSRAQKNKRLKAHKKAHGDGKNPNFHRYYPKDLPGAKAHRVLGWTHRGRTGTALGAAVTLGAGAAAAQATRKAKEKK